MLSLCPFVIALPRDESARIMKLEQESDMLKLERDNLMDKLEILKKNISEIMQNTNELEGENQNKNEKQIDMIYLNQEEGKEEFKNSKYNQIIT